MSENPFAQAGDPLPMADEPEERDPDDEFYDEDSQVRQIVLQARAKRKAGQIPDDPTPPDAVEAVPSHSPVPDAYMSDLASMHGLWTLIQQRLVVLEQHRQSCAVVLDMARQLQGSEHGPLTDLVRTMLGLE